MALTERMRSYLRAIPARTMAIWLALIITVFLTRNRWEAWVEDHVLPWGGPPYAASPDGTTIAVDHRKGLALWNVEKGREIAILSCELHGQRQFLAGGSRLFVMPMPSGHGGTADKPAPIVRRTPIVFDADTGKKLFELAAGALPASRASFSDGGKIFVSYQDGTNRIWNGVTGEVIADLRPSYGLLGWLAFSPDGSRLVTIGPGNKARLWDADTGRELRGLGITGGLEPVKFTHSGSRIVVSRFLPDSGACDIVDTETGERIASMEADRWDMGLVSAVSPDGRMVASYTHGKVFVADAETGARLHQLHPRHPVSSLRFSRGGGLLAADDTWGTYRWGSIWDVRTGECTYTSPDRLLGLRFTPDESRFVKELGYGSMEMRSARTGEVLMRMAEVKRFQVLNDNAMVISRDIGDVRVWRRTRPEWWWGVFYLWHFWLIAGLSLVLAVSIWRDVRLTRRERAQRRRD